MGGACENCSAIPLSSSRNDVILTSSIGFCCKVILNDEFLDHLFIPPRFAQKIAPLTNKNVQIQDIYGRSWTVKLSYVRGALAFASGWRSFTLDHRIKPHYQVLFSYISDSNFLCQIFGTNSSKKLHFPSACNNRPAPTYANEDSNDGNITQINKEGSPLAQGKGVKRKYCEDPCYIVNRDSGFDQNEDRRCFLHINEYEMYNSLLICTNGSSTAQDADIVEKCTTDVEDCFNLPISKEDMRIPCEGGEDFGSSLLKDIPETLAASGTEKNVIAFPQLALFQEPSVVVQFANLYPQTAAVQGLTSTVEGPPVEVKAADLEPQATACQGQTTNRPPAEAKAADLKPQTTAFKDQTSDFTGLEAEGKTETADFNCQKTAFQGQTANFTGPAMEALKADFSGQTTTHRHQDAVKEPRESEPKVFDNERATSGGSVGIAKNEQKGLNPQGFCYKVSENNLDAVAEPRESKTKDFCNETATIGGRVRTSKIDQKGQNEKGFDGSAKTAQEPNKLNSQGLGGSVGHFNIERTNFRPNGFGNETSHNNQDAVKEAQESMPKAFVNEAATIGGGVRTAKSEQKGLNQQGLVGSVKIAKEEQNKFNLQGSDAVKEAQESMPKAFVNEAATIGGRVRTAKIEQKGLNQQGLVGSAKIVKEEQKKFNLQGSGGSVGHVKIEQKNFCPSGFGGRVRTVNEELSFHPDNFDGSAQRVNNEQFNLQISRGKMSVGLVKKETMKFKPQNIASNSYQALEKGNIEVQDFTQPPPTVTCAVTSDSNFLMLPKKFSSLRKDMCVQRKVVFLTDSAGRIWPVMCSKGKSQRGLTAGWKSIRDANGIRIGDKCVFSCKEDNHGIINMNVILK